LYSNHKEYFVSAANTNNPKTADKNDAEGQGERRHEGALNSADDVIVGDGRGVESAEGKEKGDEDAEGKESEEAEGKEEGDEEAVPQGGVEEGAEGEGEEEAGSDVQGLNRESKVTAVGSVAVEKTKDEADHGRVEHVEAGISTSESVEGAEGEKQAMKESAGEKEGSVDGIKGEEGGEDVAPLLLLSKLGLVEFAGILRVHANQKYRCMPTQIFWIIYMYMQLFILNACARIISCQRPSKTRLEMQPRISAMSSML
jgi:hypothetical protein